MVDPDTGSLRGDFLAVLGDFARALDQPYGRALRPLMTQRARHPHLFAVVHQLAVQPRLDALLRVLRAAAAPGQADPDAVTERIAGVGAQLVVAAHMATGTVGDGEVAAIVDEVVLRLVAPRP